MCGIVGVAGSIGMREEKIFKQLLIVDTLRGEHSTGIASISPTGEMKIAKSVGPPSELLDSYKCNDLFRKVSRVLIGHNRYATLGEVNRNNAHPFMFENVVGVHNGTLKNKHALEDYYKFGTDSEAIYYNFDKFGAEEVVKDLEGAWCLVYFDKADKTLTFLRNKERPLFYTYSEDGKVVFWASEAWMLEGVLKREGYKTGKVFSLPEDVLLKFDMQINVFNSQMKPIEKPKGKKLAGKAPAPAYLPPVGKPAGATVKKFRVGKTLQDMLLKTSYVKLVCLDDVKGEYRSYFKPTSDIAFVDEGALIVAKVNISTYRNGKNPIHKVDPDDIVELLEKFEPKLNGYVLTEEEFYTKHCTCDWCGDFIQYGDNCFIHKEGALCEEHMNDPEVTQYFPQLKGAA